MKVLSPLPPPTTPDDVLRVVLARAEVAATPTLADVGAAVAFAVAVAVAVVLAVACPLPASVAMVVAVAVVVVVVVAVAVVVVVDVVVVVIVMVVAVAEVVVVAGAVVAASVVLLVLTSGPKPSACADPFCTHVANPAARIRHQGSCMPWRAAPPRCCAITKLGC